MNLDKQIKLWGAAALSLDRGFPQGLFTRRIQPIRIQLLKRLDLYEANILNEKLIHPKLSKQMMRVAYRQIIDQLMRIDAHQAKTLPFWGMGNMTPPSDIPAEIWAAIILDLFKQLALEL